MMRRRFVLLLVIVMLAGMMPGAAFAAEADPAVSAGDADKTEASIQVFTDMPDNWSKTALQNAVNNGLLTGYNGKIMPKDCMTRAQMAAVLNRAFGAKKMASLSGYTDVPPGAWYYEDMAKAVQMRAFAGNDNRLDPEDKISRQEAFTVLARAFKLTGADVGILDRFADRSLISSWAKDASASLVSAGYLTGSNGKLNPAQNITRAEFAKIMDDLLRNYITKAGAYTGDLNGNVMINSADVTLSDLKVTGDLIIGDGVGDGDVTLDNVTVTGRTVIRGGGVNSIKITRSSSLQNIVIARVGGEVRVYSEDGAQIGEVIVDGNDDVIIEGTAGTITVAAPDVTVKATNANIGSAVINGENSRIIVSQNSNIQLVTVNSQGVEISGTGKITKVEANADNVTVSTVGTRVISAVGTSGVMAGTLPVSEGNQEIVPGNKGNSGGSNRNNPPSTPPGEPATDASYFLFDAGTGTITGYDFAGGTDVIIPSVISGVSVAHIGDSAFKAGGGEKRGGSGSDDMLTSVVIPNSVMVIGDSAFANNGLTEIAIPDSVQTIGEAAFSNCGIMSCVNLGSGVSSIGVNAFSDCGALEEFIVSPDNGYYSSTDDGVLFNKDKTVLLQFPVSCGIESYEIPSGVAEIGNSAFEGCYSLTGVTIPDSVEIIGDSAFEFCGSLTGLSIPSGVETIGDSAFFYCSGLTDLIIPESVERIGSNAFTYSGLTSLTIQGANTSTGTSIEANAFSYCENLATVILEDGVTVIGDHGFYRCTSLSSITISNTVESIGEYAFYACGDLNQITFPDSVESIGVRAFAWCTGLIRVTIGAEVTVGDYAVSVNDYDNNFKETYDDGGSGGAGTYNRIGAWTKEE